ncbi:MULTISPECIES: helix-turn-helix transcriptional regulator [unclassified Mycobacterium]|uniref:helix-turn-helix transcriptional regulator n=1 Tax=unclassified Mycobacterium TaxID=2642494 RepID=UPI0029C613EF|nr:MULTISPECIES: LuxR C-terminal-related transcriptional regulator [unclassified Mycobacterium]
MRVRSLGKLPAEVTNFVGRERELAQVRRALTASRLLTLTGPGGVGKTRLARRVASDLHPAFPDGVWLVELAELGQGDLLALHTAVTLGLTDTSGDPAQSLADYLCDKTLLLVIDNCEHLIQPVANLVSRLLAAAPELRVLATSRHVLGSDGEYLFEVPPLSIPKSAASDRIEPSRVHSEAVDLFLDRAAAVLPALPAGPEFRRSVIEICRRLDGIPLAIELAVARLRAYPVGEILARLERSLDVLTTGPRSAPPRHQTLKATIDWSFELCSSAEQLLWARLSVFAGGFDLDAAESVCADDRLPQDDVFDLVAGLVDKSILRRQAAVSGRGARFSMLETMREYGKERLVTVGEAKEVRVRHLCHFAALAQRGHDDFFTEREIVWFQDIRANHANIRLALQECISGVGEPNVAMSIASVLRMFWASPGLVVEGCQWLRKALAADTEPSAARAEALWVLAYVEVLLAEVDSAVRSMAECRKLAGDFSLDRISAALTLCPIMADFMLGDTTAALADAEGAVAAGLAVGDPAITGEAMFFASAMAFVTGDSRADKLAIDALSFMQAHGAQLWRGSALWINGLMHCRRDRREVAVDCFREALVIFRQMNHDLGTAMCLDGMAWAVALSGEYVRAARLQGAADVIWQAGPLRMPYQFDRHEIREKVEALIREGIGHTAFDQAFADGMSLPLDSVIGRNSGSDVREESGADDSVIADQLESLTQRERKVAELLAKGMRNREIAAELVVSPRTVESHVQNILTKLGFHSRTQIAAWVSRTQLSNR